MVGKVATDYDVTLTVTVTSPYATAAEQPDPVDEIWTVTLLNPCLDVNFVRIRSPGIDELDYIVFEGLKNDYPAHDEFIVETEPLVGHSLCGALKYEGQYKGTPVPTVNGQPGGEVLAYDPATRKFSVQTDDADLIETNQPY